MESRKNGCNPWSELLEVICSTDGFVVELLGGLTKEECKTSCIAKTERIFVETNNRNNIYLRVCRWEKWMI